MSEPLAKERPPVDLDEFEHRLQASDRHAGDPLAELARLVGNTHDPYSEVFAQESGHYQAADHDPYASRRDPVFDAPSPHSLSPRLSGDFAAIEAGLRGALSAHPTTDFHDPDDGHEYYAQHQQYSQDEAAYLQDHEEAYLAAPQGRDRRRSLRPVYAMVATIAVGVVGVGIAFAYKGVSSSPSQIRTIVAAAGPTKVQPPADTSSDQANHDAAILGGGQTAPTQLVNREEAPVDLSQAVHPAAPADVATAPDSGNASSVPVPPAPSQSASNGSADATPSTDPAPSFGMSGMPEPKKVKVVSVRPDGTILPDSVPSITAAPSTEPVAEPAPAADAAPPSADKPTAATSTPSSSAPKTTTSHVAGHSRSKATTRVAAKPAGDDLGNGDGAAEAPAAKPAHKSKPQRLASADPSPTADIPAQPTETEAAAHPAGGFAVQLAAPGSEAEARAATSRFAKKFAAALEGRRIGFHRAQSNGKSVFRVRVGSLSREDAVSLCDKLKAGGGACFVAKNN